MSGGSPPPKTSQQMAEFHRHVRSRDRRLHTAELDRRRVRPSALARSGSFIQPVSGAFVFNPSGGFADEPERVAAWRSAAAGRVRVHRHRRPRAALPARRGVARVSFTTLPADTPSNTPSHVVAWPDGGALVRPAPDPDPHRGRTGRRAGDAGRRAAQAGLRRDERGCSRCSCRKPRSWPCRSARSRRHGDLQVLGVWSLLTAAAQLAQLADAAGGPALDADAVADARVRPRGREAAARAGGRRGRLGHAAHRSARRSVSLVGSIDNHAKSTGRIDVEAAWSEQLDDVLRDLPEDGVDGRPRGPGSGMSATSHSTPTRTTAAPAATTSPRLASKPPTHQLRHELGDTRHRRVSYHAVATTRFREYFPPEIIDGHDPAGRPADHPRRRRAGARGSEFPAARAAGRHVRDPDVRVVGGDAVGPRGRRQGSRAPPASSGSGSGRPPSARGGASTAATIVANLPKTFRRLRQGGGLRVYLRRPWFSSGDGELLGVVLKDQPWITWPIDEAGGLFVDAAAKANADLIATRIFERGVVQPKGSARLAASERLVASLGGATHVRRGRPATSRWSMGCSTSSSSRCSAASTLTSSSRTGAPTRSGGPPCRPAARTSTSSRSASPSGPACRWPRRPRRRSRSSATGRSTTPTGSCGSATSRSTPARRTSRSCARRCAGINRTRSRTRTSRASCCADYAQLIADRTASLTKSRSSATVTVRGPAAYNETATFLGADTQGPGAVEAEPVRHGAGRAAGGRSRPRPRVDRGRRRGAPRGIGRERHR